MTERGSGDAEQRILVIGAGIAGLAAALRARSLDSACGITLVDGAARFGGKIDGEMVAGCVVDGGADVCIGTKLRATHLFRDLRLESRVVTVNPNRLPSYEKRDGRLQPAATPFNDELLTFREGMRELTDAACAALTDVTAITNSPIESLSRAGSHWKAVARNGATHGADAVIMATPASATGAVLSGLIRNARETLGSVESPATTTVTVAFRSADVPHQLDGTGYLGCDPDSNVSALTWTSSKNPAHAAPGVALIRGYVRGVTCDAAALVLRECATVLGINTQPIFVRTYHWPAGIPLYPANHQARVRSLEDDLHGTPGLFIAGSAFHGVGIPDCIASGERAAASAVAFLARRESEEMA